ncbi:BREX-3 system P-loop-containing protein BrxF [uncultured Mailhella sp.]|uniref:BREX-3 system P-loop-containing protein BrxF n=1 Tax=uncultured Mailhella sp. TaxID=1981031 RepID=UPI00320B65E3
MDFIQDELDDWSLSGGASYRSDKPEIEQQGASMAELIHDKIKRSIQTAEGLYYRLILLVGKTGSGKTGVLRKVAEEFGSSVVNVNLVLSGELLELTVKQRSLRIPGILDQLVEQMQSPVLLDNLEILFDKNLRQDPLRLLQSISRKRTVVASWNGVITSGRLLYAENGHPEYRNYDSVDALIVSMDGTYTLDSVKENREAE